MPLISVNDVQIKGLTVEVKSLVVGKKQLTLSLMRQFIEESIIDQEHMLLRGVPWGFINYFWGEHKEKTPQHFLHLIWQKGDELRRCVIRKVHLTYEVERHINYSVKEINELNDQITETSKKVQESIDNLKDIEEGRQKETHWVIEHYKKIIVEGNARTNSLETMKKKEEQDYYATKRYLEESIPKYNTLIESMKDLPHFFIAV